MKQGLQQSVNFFLLAVWLLSWSFRTIHVALRETVVEQVGEISLSLSLLLMPYTSSDILIFSRVSDPSQDVANRYQQPSRGFSSSSGSFPQIQLFCPSAWQLCMQGHCSILMIAAGVLLTFNPVMNWWFSLLNAGYTPVCLGLLSGLPTAY